MDTLNSVVSSWVSRFGRLIPSGAVLDLACGSGRHVLWLASLSQNLSVLAVDRDAAALAVIDAVGVATLEAELESGDAAALAQLFRPHRFSGVVVTNYLHRPLFPLILDSIAAQGVLIYETFAAGNEHFGKPSNPDFLLRPGELPALLAADSASNWHVLAFEDGFVEQPRAAMVQRICAIKQAGGVASTRRIA